MFYQLLGAALLLFILWRWMVVVDNRDKRKALSGLERLKQVFERASQCAQGAADPIPRVVGTVATNISCIEIMIKGPRVNWGHVNRWIAREESTAAFIMRWMEAEHLKDAGLLLIPDPSALRGSP